VHGQQMIVRNPIDHRSALGGPRTLEGCVSVVWVSSITWRQNGGQTNIATPSWVVLRPVHVPAGIPPERHHDQVLGRIVNESNMLPTVTRRKRCSSAASRVANSPNQFSGCVKLMQRAWSCCIALVSL
jgi:hypothetical protein